MRFSVTALAPATLIESVPFVDERGTFRRLHCEREFRTAGLPTAFVQSNLSLTRRRGSIRGMHFQRPPSAEGKVVRCTRGAIHDVIIDLRRDSATYLEHLSVELSPEEGLALFVPPGFAHGFQTLTDNAEVLYFMTNFYSPELSDGVRWDDPALGINWPLPPQDISEKDAAYPGLSPDRDFGF